LYALAGPDPEYWVVLLGGFMVAQAGLTYFTTRVRPRTA
jgi:hypothetical protein